MLWRLYIPHQLAAAVFPTIDTLQTNIRHICPAPFKPKGLYCQYTKYRRIDGYCMNPYHPTWGAAAQAMKRFVLPRFADGSLTYILFLIVIGVGKLW